MTPVPGILTGGNWANLSSCGTYRYSLGRHVSFDPGSALFIMLNPSTADASVDDPTIRRCKGFCQLWGYGSLMVGNLFAYRATDPDRLRQIGRNPAVGNPENDRHLAQMASIADKVVLAWGVVHRHLVDRESEVIDLLVRMKVPQIYHLGMTKRGAPRHPLYLRRDAELQVLFG